MVADSPLQARSGGKVLVDQLLLQGVDRIFAVPGESYLPVLDALHDVPERIALTVCRHEAGAANMADAYGKLTGRPGICFVTRGPGATHASVGIHTASQDSTPLVLFVGQVQHGHLGREAFQELDLEQAFGGMAKWVAQVDDARRLPELVSRAFHVAVSGRPGPVVLGLPEDALDAVVEVRDATPAAPSRAWPSPDDMQRLRNLLQAAERPLVIVGGGAWSPETSRQIEHFAAANDLPVASSFRRQDHVDNHSPQYVGMVGLAIDPELADRVRDADLLIAIGARLGDAATGGYSLVASPVPEQRLVHVLPDPDELGRVYAGALHIPVAPAEFARAAAALEPVDGSAWSSWRENARTAYLAFVEPPVTEARVDLGAVMRSVREALPPNAIVTNGAGNYTVWMHRFLQFSEVRTQLAPTSGAMGYGVPAAVAAKLVAPERTVVGFAGDGCFLMAAQELATAVQYGAAVVLVVVNNEMYGTIRMHQERRYPGRAFGVDLTNPDFAALARSYGARAEVCVDHADFAEAFRRALDADGPYVIELQTDPRQLSPGMRL